MSQFNSLGAFALHISSLQARQQHAAEKGLKKVAQAIEKTAKSEFGVYQPAVGPFSEWAPLAESTQEERLRLGFTPDDPLLRTGQLKNSISHEVHGTEAAVGSPSDVMVAQELGTPRIPPRPVLGPAAIRNKQLILKTLGQAAVEGLLPPGVVAPNYNNLS